MTSKGKLVGLAAAGALGVWFLSSVFGTVAPEGEAILQNRVWIDHLPNRPAEHYEVFAALHDSGGGDPGGIGIFQRASSYEGDYALFQWAPKGDTKMRLKMLQSGSNHAPTYRARECKEKDFDYCLELEGAPRGVKRYVSKKGWEIDAAGNGIAEIEAVKKSITPDDEE